MAIRRDRSNKNKLNKLQKCFFLGYWLLSGVGMSVYSLQHNRELKPSDAIVLMCVGGFITPIAIVVLPIMWLDEHATIKIKK